MIAIQTAPHYLPRMDHQAPPKLSLYAMQAALDRAIDDVAGGRVVPASEVHARLRRAMASAASTSTGPEQHGTHSIR